MGKSDLRGPPFPIAMSTQALVGVDGCPGGWIAVTEADGRLYACVYKDWNGLMREVGGCSLIAVDIPIGLPSHGARQCDTDARRYLGVRRGSSVFPTPVRDCLISGSYGELSARHRRVDGRGLSRQAFNLLPKIQQVDRYLLDNLLHRHRIHEVHPEVSFATWNAGRALQQPKTSSSGRGEREGLIDSVWKAERTRLLDVVKGAGCRPDDLNDAFAALWSARRIVRGLAREWPQGTVALDERGLRMRILA